MTDDRVACAVACFEIWAIWAAVVWLMVAAWRHCAGPLFAGIAGW
jgi:hypothetical protein